MASLEGLDGPLNSPIGNALYYYKMKLSAIVDSKGSQNNRLNFACYTRYQAPIGFPSSPVRPLLRASRVLMEQTVRLKSLFIERNETLGAVRAPISMQAENAACKEIYSTMTVQPAVLRTKDAAQYLAISPWFLRKLVHEGRIRFLPGKVLRFRVVDLDSYLAESVL